jgi:hypothetical protein
MTTRCNLSLMQTNGMCYYMTWTKTRKITGVACNKVKLKKLCPYHPKYKEYKSESTQ